MREDALKIFFPLRKTCFLCSFWLEVSFNIKREGGKETSSKTSEREPPEKLERDQHLVAGKAKRWEQSVVKCC